MKPQLGNVLGWLWDCTGVRSQNPVLLAFCPAGNDLSRSFHWGPAFSWKWVEGFEGLYNTLKRVSQAGRPSGTCCDRSCTLYRRKFTPTFWGQGIRCHLSRASSGAVPAAGCRMHHLEGLSASVCAHVRAALRPRPPAPTLPAGL
jgi:hypothetical protein